MWSTVARQFRVLYLNYIYYRSEDSMVLRSLETCFFCHLKTVWGGQMKTFGFCSIDVQDSKMISVCPRPRRKNRDNSMLPDFHNVRLGTHLHSTLRKFCPKLCELP